MTNTPDPKTPGAPPPAAEHPRKSLAERTAPAAAAVAILCALIALAFTVGILVGA